MDGAPRDMSQLHHACTPLLMVASPLLPHAPSLFLGTWHVVAAGSLFVMQQCLQKQHRVFKNMLLWPAVWIILSSTEDGHYISMAITIVVMHVASSGWQTASAMSAHNL